MRVKFVCVGADPISTLTRQISSECVHCVGFQWAKTASLGKFWHFGRSCTDPLIPMRVKFGVLEQTKGLHIPAKFRLNVFIVSASGDQKPQYWANFDNFGRSCTDPLYRWGSNLACWSRPKVYTNPPSFIWMCSLRRLPMGKNHNFGQILTLWGLLYRPPNTDEGQICVFWSRPRSTLTRQISSECVHCVGFQWPKTASFGKFCLWHFWALLYRPPYTDEGQIWCVGADPRSTLTRQISSECVHCVGFQWAKNTILHKFRHFGGSCIDPLLPMRVKFGLL